MNYQLHYDRLIESRKNRVLELDAYYERHHIVMKSMGGIDDKENLVMLTAREHFLAHWLLWRIYRNRQTAAAFSFMRRYSSSMNVYSELREASVFANKEFWKNLSKEERYEIVKKRMAKWTKESRSSNAGRSSKIYWNSLSEKEIFEKQSALSKRRWDKLSLSERSIIQSIKSKKSWNISNEERSERARKIWAKRRENNTQHRKVGIKLSEEAKQRMRDAARMRKISKT